MAVFWSTASRNCPMTRGMLWILFTSSWAWRNSFFRFFCSSLMYSSCTSRNSSSCCSFCRVFQILRFWCQEGEGGVGSGALHHWYLVLQHHNIINQLSQGGWEGGDQPGGGGDQSGGGGDQSAQETAKEETGQGSWGTCVEVDSDTEAVANQGFKLGCISCKMREEIPATASVKWFFKARHENNFTQIYSYKDKMGDVVDERFYDRLEWNGSKRTGDLQDGSVYILNVTYNDTGTYSCVFNRTLTFPKRATHTHAHANKTFSIIVVPKLNRAMASILSEVMMYVSIISLQLWLLVEMIYCYRKISSDEEAQRDSHMMAEYFNAYLNKEHSEGVQVAEYRPSRAQVFAAPQRRQSLGAIGAARLAACYHGNLRLEQSLQLAHLTLCKPINMLIATKWSGCWRNCVSEENSSSCSLSTPMRTTRFTCTRPARSEKLVVVLTNEVAVEVGAEELGGTAAGSVGGEQGGPASRGSELRLRPSEDTSSTERWEEEQEGGVSPRGLKGPQGGRPRGLAELSSNRSDTDSDSSPGLRRRREERWGE
ncbi:Sodium channel subunit beta-1 [Merluccius polli]|uniref:Sodium channel regulatory subunit beta-3 n=1 Tax=Merluccius polli TaxID=89951 RepID=A0AA47LZT9_MERPO|nr:Sodium channel subunit beta-1 [Merluccius polli]